MTHNAPSPRVLLIEDDFVQAALVRRWLEAEGVTVRHANCGSRAWDLLAGGTAWDLVICDINLPDQSGLELLRAFRPRSRGVPFLLLTAYREFDGAVEALRNGAADYLVKPVTREALMAKVASCLDERRGAPRRASVLAVGASVEEIVQGCGGSLLAHSKRGDAVTLVAVRMDPDAIPCEEQELRSKRVAHALGAQLKCVDLTAEGDDLEGIRGALHHLAVRTEVDTVYLPSQHGESTKTRALHAAVRDTAGPGLTVLAYQPSRCTVEFRPSKFVDIHSQVEEKLELLGRCIGASEDRRQQTELARATALYWSRYGGSGPAEPLEIIRATA